MKPAELAQVRGDLVAFAAEMLAPLPRSDQRRWGETYLRGLLLYWRRKSIEPLAARLAGDDEQCLPAVRQPEPLAVGAGARAPGAAHGKRDRAARLDRRRGRLAQGGALLGRRRQPVLGHPGQGRGLPDRRLALGRLHGGQLPAYLAPLPWSRGDLPGARYRRATLVRSNGVQNIGHIVCLGRVHASACTCCVHLLPFRAHHTTARETVLSLASSLADSL